MTRIEEILSRALLVRDRSVPRDIVPPSKSAYSDWDPAAPVGAQGQTPVSSAAAEDLRALCETLVTHAPANDVADFVTEQVPEPRSAMILACVLQLTDTDDGARYWWQYAWGAGQSAAAYCLYLHHLSQGEAHLADWWHRHTNDGPNETPEEPGKSPEPAQTWHPANQQVTKASTATMLRVLRHLAKHTTRPYSAVLVELMEYIPTAVASGYLRQPDWEMPLPGPDFSTRVAHLLDTAPQQPDTRRPELPARNPRTPDPAPTTQRPTPSKTPEPHAVSTCIRDTAAR
ncbi:hypothetical protein [Streptomyces zhihengii]|uniref:Uncharacterized protein n=1 Tax=Streptomyces zhihengii TaxID=1818004 RepID=A0ABS2V4T9_9ACTN|nr:hypothetical protein [Streptomyces zhihengii]MBM9624743.1 hypothetical protein [Streptomyces zhihengii]